MSNYIKTTDFAIKDTYSSGDPRKVAKGADVDTEFNNIATAVATKQDSASKGIANGFAPLDGSALVTKTFQWTTTAYTDAANVFNTIQTISQNVSSGAWLKLNDLFTGAGTNAHLWINAPNNTRGAEILLGGNGATTPSKTIRAISGVFQILNNAANVALFSMDDSGNVTANSFAGIGSSLTALNASSISSGSIPAANVPSSAVTQYAGSMKCRNLPSKAGTNVTLQNGGSPSGGSDGDIFYIY